MTMWLCRALPSVLVGGLALVVPARVAAQVPFRSPTFPAAGVVAAVQTLAPIVTVSSERCAASVEAARTEPYDDAPSASIPYPCIGNSGATAPQLRIRAWKEADATRVVVFFVTVSDGAPPDAEKQVATFLLTAGQSVELPPATTSAGAAVTISAK